MKRPLCHLAILLTAVVYLYLEFFSSGFFYDVPADSRGTYVTLTGKVWSKSIKPGFNGGLTPVIDIIPFKKSKGSFELVECFFEEGESNLPSIGEYVEVRGKLKAFDPPTNPGEFDSRLYYSTLKISYRLTGARMTARGGRKNAYREMLFKIRLFLSGALDSVLDKEDAAIMKAMLLGDKAYMDDEIKDMYKNSGIMHILAVSGLHISIIGMGLYRLLRRLTGKLADALDAVTDTFSGGIFEGFAAFLALFDKVFPVAASIAFMYSYGVMCGMGTSSFRAIMMFTLRLLAPVFGRTYDILSALALAELLLVLDQPLYLYNSGFLFSFGAVFGIAVIYPCLKFSTKDERTLKMNFADDRKPLSAVISGRIRDGVMSGISIALATLPVYASFYYVYPVQSIFLNLLVIPVMGVLMVLGIITLLFGAAVLYLSKALYLPGRLTGFAVHGILSFYKWLCSFDGMTRHMTWYMGHSEKWQIAAYVIIIAAFVFLSGYYVRDSSGRSKEKTKGTDSYNVKWIAWLILPAAAVFVLTFHVNPDLEINLIDVGQGDAIVVRSGSKAMLIDGGSTSKKKVGRYQIIPFLKYLGIGELETLVLTHEDEDHISGIFEVLDDMENGGISVKSMLLPEIEKGTGGENYRRLEKRATELGITLSYINSGERFSLGNADFLCLNPERNMSFEGANEYSTVLYMEYPQNAAAFGEELLGGEEGREADSTFTALFTGDVEGQGQDYLTKELKRIQGSKNVYGDIFEEGTGLDLLKVSHHGSKYTTDEEFLKLIHPHAAVISCGRDNSYGHPHEEVLERLREIGSDIYRTDESGCISIKIYGKNAVFYHFFISKFIQFG